MSFRDWRRAAAILAIPALLALSATPALAISGLKSGAPALSPADFQTPPNACADPAYSLLGGKWKTTLRWSFQSSSSPEE